MKVVQQATCRELSQTFRGAELEGAHLPMKRRMVSVNHVWTEMSERALVASRGPHRRQTRHLQL